MGTHHADDIESGVEPRTDSDREVTIHDLSDHLISPDGEKVNFMDEQEALDAHSMMRTAIDAMTFDPQALKRSIDKDRTPSTSKKRRRLDIRLVFTVVAILFLILWLDLLIQIF